MNAINDGGQAFPSASEHFNTEGMTLRDWFAGMALQGIIGSIFCTPQVTFEECSGRAYAMADAMLAARQPKEVQP